MSNYVIHCPSCKEEVSKLFHDLCFKCLPKYKEVTISELISSYKEDARESIIAVFQKELDDIHSGEKYKDLPVFSNHRTLEDSRNIKWIILMIKNIKL